MQTNQLMKYNLANTKHKLNESLRSIYNKLHLALYFINYFKCSCEFVISVITQGLT